MTTKRSNNWQLHVKKFAHENGINYRDAMKHSDCKSTYHASKVTTDKANHTISFHTADNPPSVKKPTKQLTKKRMTQDLLDLEKQLESLKKNSSRYKTLQEASQSLRLRLASKSPQKKVKSPAEPAEPKPKPSRKKKIKPIPETETPEPTPEPETPELTD